MSRFVIQYKDTYVIKEMGSKIGCVVGFFHQPTKNLMIEKSYSDE